MIGVTIYALSQRSHARHQTRVAIAATEAARHAQQQADENAEEAQQAQAAAESNLHTATTAEASARQQRDKANGLAALLKSSNTNLKSTLGELTVQRNTATTAKNQAQANPLSRDTQPGSRARRPRLRSGRRTARTSRRRSRRTRRRSPTHAGNCSLAQATLDVNPALSVSYALAAAGTLPAQTVTMLRDSLARLHELRIVGSSSRPIGATALSADGTQFATARGATGVTLFSARTGKAIRSLAPAGTV